MSRRPISTVEVADNGKLHSRLNSAVFGLLCFIPVFGTVVFGAVDNITWILIVALTTIMIGLWLIDAARSGHLEIAADALQIPCICLIILGLFQLLPLGAGAAESGLSLAATRSLSLDPYATRFFVRNLVILFLFLT